MRIQLSDRLVAALRTEYPNCLTTAGAVTDLVDAVLWQHLSMIARTRAAVASWQSTEAQPVESAAQPPASRVHVRPHRSLIFTYV